MNLRFECENFTHLGNVMAVVTDRKIGYDTNADTIVNLYRADIASIQDYYPFGMVIPGRTFSSFTCGFGYQGAKAEQTDHLKPEQIDQVNFWRRFHIHAVVCCVANVSFFYG